MRGFSSPSEFDSLSALYEMFPLVPADTIRLIHLELGSDPTATASFLISEAEHSGNITGSTTGKNKADFFKRIPAVQLDVILAFLTFVDLATFSATSHQNRYIVEKILASSTKFKTFRIGHFRHWPDWRILGMIARFPIISKLDLSRSAEFKSFSLLPSSVKRVQDLKVLILSDCINFQNEHFQQMTEFFSHLEVLDISGTLISDECMDFLSFKAIELKRLDISRCTELTDFGLGELLAKRIRTLEAINISGTSLGYESIRHIERTEEHLHISTLLWSGSRKLGSFSLELKNLQVLDLHNSTHLLDARLVLPSLTFLNLSSSKQIRFLQLEAPLLTVLNLSGCRLLQELNGAFGCIKALNVYACGSLSLPCIRDLILSNASSLAFLDLTGLFQLEDQESIELLKECSQLNDLLISGCKKLTQRSISYILSRFPEALTVTSESSKRRTELFRLPQT